MKKYFKAATSNYFDILSFYQWVTFNKNLLLIFFCKSFAFHLLCVGAAMNDLQNSKANEVEEVIQNLLKYAPNRIRGFQDKVACFQINSNFFPGLVNAVIKWYLEQYGY